MSIQSDLYYLQYLGGADFRAKTVDNRGADNRCLIVLQKSWVY